MSIFGFDIETTSLKLFHPDTKLLCASLAQDTVITYVHDHPERRYINEEENLLHLATIGNCFMDSSNVLVGHNLQFDITGWERYYKEQGNPVRSIRCQLFDTMIAHYLIDAESKNSLDYVAQKYLGVEKIGLPAKSIATAPLRTLVFYNAVDSLLVYKLYHILYEQLEKQGSLILFNYLMKILNVLIEMQLTGVRLDLDYIRSHRSDVENKIEEIESKLRKIFGEINFRSPKQLAESLYDELELPILERTPTGNPSTGVDTIVKLKASDSVNKKQKRALQSLLDYRKLQKINSTYLEPLEYEHLGYDGRIHTSYYLGKGYDSGHSFGTITGRTSSSNPNLQNIPNTVTVNGFTINVRRAFIPGEGTTFYKADYSQLEMRIAAFLSKDKRMLKVFKDGIDIHTYSLTGVYEEDYDFIREKLEEGDKEWKRRRLLIKNFNFALIYGASPFKLQMMLLKQLEIDMPIGEVRRIIRQWHKLYKHFTEWRYLIHEIIERDGEIITETGRRRFFFDPNHRLNINYKDMAKYLREGLNAIIQSFGSDIAVLGLLSLFHNDQNITPLLLVHDSMDGEIRSTSLDDRGAFEDFFKQAMIDKPKQILMEDFDVDTDDLYLDIDVQFGLEAWG